jgi:curved DNA-binding protein CbpA
MSAYSPLMAARDPYDVLGVRPDASDEQVRRAYRHLVQLHHPDHNNGSAVSARRFEEVQDAYARIRRLRAAAAAPKRAAEAPGDGSTPSHTDGNPDLEARLAELERQLRKANAARKRARRAAAEAATASDNRRPTDEELGYVTTDDSFSKILADARSELGDRIGEAGEHPVAGRIRELIDEVAAKLARGGPRGSGD